MANNERHDRASAGGAGAGDQPQRPAGGQQHTDAPTPDAVGSGLSGGVTDIDRRDGEADDSNSGYSDEDLMRTGGGGLGEQTTGSDDTPSV